MSENQMELHDENLEVVDEMSHGVGKDVAEPTAHDPDRAEVQSVDSVTKAGESGVKSKSKGRKGDKSNSQASELKKTKAGMVSDMYHAINSMDKSDVAVLYNSMFTEGADEQEVEIPMADVEIDFSEDLNALVESEGTLSDEFKSKTAIIFEAAVKSKLAKEIDRLEENYATELDEEITRTREDLVEKVDSYLNYVVEAWMEENRLAVTQGIRTEIAEGFMDKMRDLFVESYIEVPESKVDVVDELSSQVEELEETLSDTMVKAIAMSEELEGYKRAHIISENSEGLTDTQIEKLFTLTEDVDFEDEEKFAEKVSTIKESYFTKKAPVEAGDITEEIEEDDQVQVSSSMEKYLQAIRSATN